MKDVTSGIYDSVVEHPAKSLLCLTATVATGGAAFYCAPAIAGTLGAAGWLGATATTGTAINSLTGVALTNASLASLGGGALAVGGGGMATGASFVGGTGAVVGAGVSSGVAVAVKR